MEDGFILKESELQSVIGGVYVGPCITYVVVKGDNLTKIARKFGTDIDTLVTLNKIKDRNRIYIGQVLMIPAK